MRPTLLCSALAATMLLSAVQALPILRGAATDDAPSSVLLRRGGDASYGAEAAYSASVGTKQSLSSAGIDDVGGAATVDPTSTARTTVSNGQIPVLARWKARWRAYKERRKQKLLVTATHKLQREETKIGEADSAAAGSGGYSSQYQAGTGALSY